MDWFPKIEYRLYTAILFELALQRRIWHGQNHIDNRCVKWLIFQSPHTNVFNEKCITAHASLNFALWNRIESKDFPYSQYLFFFFLLRIFSHRLGACIAFIFWRVFSFVSIIILYDLLTLVIENIDDYVIAVECVSVYVLELVFCRWWTKNAIFFVLPFRSYRREYFVFSSSFVNKKMTAIKRINDTHTHSTNSSFVCVCMK